MPRPLAHFSLYACCICHLVAPQIQKKCIFLSNINNKKEKKNKYAYSFRHNSNEKCNSARKAITSKSARGVSARLQDTLGRACVPQILAFCLTLVCTETPRCLCFCLCFLLPWEAHSCLRSVLKVRSLCIYQVLAMAYEWNASDIFCLWLDLFPDHENIYLTERWLSRPVT